MLKHVGTDNTVKLLPPLGLQIGTRARSPDKALSHETRFIRQKQQSQSAATGRNGATQEGIRRKKFSYLPPSCCCHFIYIHLWFTYIYIQGWVEVGLQLWACKTQSWILYYYYLLIIAFLYCNWKPFSHVCMYLQVYIHIYISLYMHISIYISLI